MICTIYNLKTNEISAYIYIAVLNFTIHQFPDMEMGDEASRIRRTILISRKSWQKIIKTNLLKTASNLQKHKRNTTNISFCCIIIIELSHEQDDIS